MNQNPSSHQRQNSISFRPRNDGGIVWEVLALDGSIIVKGEHQNRLTGLEQAQTAAYKQYQTEQTGIMDNLKKISEHIDNERRKSGVLYQD